MSGSAACVRSPRPTCPRNRRAVLFDRINPAPKTTSATPPRIYSVSRSVPLPECRSGHDQERPLSDPLLLGRYAAALPRPGPPSRILRTSVNTSATASSTTRLNAIAQAELSFLGPERRRLAPEQQDALRNSAHRLRHPDARPSGSSSGRRSASATPPAFASASGSMTKSVPGASPRGHASTRIATLRESISAYARSRPRMP